MSLDRQFLNPCEPRGRLIARIIENWLNGVVGHQTVYAERVREIYETRTNPDERIVSFHHTGDAVADMAANRQIVMRILRGMVHLKSDLEESFVLALPEQPQKELRRRLAARYNELAVPIPNSSPAGASADLSRALKEIGEWVQATGKLLEGDMVISAADPLQALEEALAETDEAMSEILGLREAILAAISNKRSGRG